MGAVIPAKRITLSPEVAGRIVFMSPLVIPGGAVQQGQTLIRIDARDYEAVVKMRQSELASAQLKLKLEQGNQLVAQQEYKMLDDIVQDQDQELVLRKPHLEECRAIVAAAEAALAKAQLDVDRCTITAPFNAVIQDKFVDVGAQVATSSSLLTLMGTDEYWVEVKVPVDQLRWLTIPDHHQPAGSPVNIFNSTAWGSDTFRTGQVLRLLGQLEEEGRMAQLLVSVKDPLALESDDVPPILVDSYVRVEIEGITLEGVFGVKRDYLHDGDNLWIMNAQNRMDIRPVEVVFRDKQRVYLSDTIRPGDRIVTTDISAPVQGMLLRLDEPVDAEPAGERTETVKPEAQE
jgi:biotin carboxyl carrier protein